MYATCASTFCCTAAGFGEVEMNDQQIQTETVQPAEPHVETDNVTQQQGVSTTAIVRSYIGSQEEKIKMRAYPANIGRKSITISHLANNCVILKCLLIMFNVQLHKSYNTICFTAGGSDEVEVKDNQTRIETMGQEVQAGEIVHQQGAHVHYYWAAIYSV